MIRTLYINRVSDINRSFFLPSELHPKSLDTTLLLFIKNPEMLLIAYVLKGRLKLEINF